MEFGHKMFKCSNIYILLSYFEISQVDIIELASSSLPQNIFRENQNIGNLVNAVGEVAASQKLIIFPTIRSYEQLYQRCL